jgi:hypothetical protein
LKSARFVHRIENEAGELKGNGGGSVKSNTLEGKRKLIGVSFTRKLIVLVGCLPLLLLRKVYFAE